MQNSTLLYNTVKYTKVQYITVEYSTVQYSKVQYSKVKYSTVKDISLLYSTEHGVLYMSKLQYRLNVTFEYFL